MYTQVRFAIEETWRKPLSEFHTGRQSLTGGNLPIAQGWFAICTVRHPESEEAESMMRSGWLCPGRRGRLNDTTTARATGISRKTTEFLGVWGRHDVSQLLESRIIICHTQAGTNSFWLNRGCRKGDYRAGRKRENAPRQERRNTLSRR